MSLFEVTLHAARQMKRLSHKMWRVLNMSVPGQTCICWHKGYTSLPGFSPTFTYASWYCQWHLETNYEHLKECTSARVGWNHFPCPLITFILQIAEIIWNIIKANNQVFFFFFLQMSLFIYLFLAVLGLRFCARSFSSCGEWGPLFIAVCRPLTIAASLVAGHRLQMRRLSSCGSRA